MRKRTLARENVLKILYQLNLTGDSAEDILARYWQENTFEAEVREFCERILKGTLENLERIDGVISRYADNWDIKRMAVIDRNILRFATYELLFMGDIPPKVTINEAVNVAKKYSQEESGKFVNGVLDKINHTEPPVEKKAESGK